jgi:hypothetical protein
MEHEHSVTLRLNVSVNACTIFLVFMDLANTITEDAAAAHVVRKSGSLHCDTPRKLPGSMVSPKARTHDVLDAFDSIEQQI